VESGLAAQTAGVGEVNPERPEGGAPIRAAGGVAARGTEVVLVHRPRFDDWSLPKGKVKRTEHPVVGAVREVREETGVRAVVGARLPTVTYDVWSGDQLVPKVVDYWAMTVTGELPFRPGREVDELVWLPVDQAIARATYPHDRRVLRAFAGLPRLTRPILLLRHGSAGERDEWTGPDAERPLDPLGERQADDLARLLPSFAPSVLVSAEPRRCRDTLTPAAQSLGLTMVLDPRFNEDARPELAAARLRELADPESAVVVCSQGGLIPGAVAKLDGRAPVRYRTAKGEGWSLLFTGRRLTVVDALSTSAR
jgi:8-oxo-(d)GTP phosphatase